MHKILEHFLNIKNVHLQNEMNQNTRNVSGFIHFERYLQKKIKKLYKHQSIGEYFISFGILNF